MSTIIETKVHFLAEKIVPHMRKMLLASDSGSGDLAVTEDAIGIALNSVRTVLVDAALEVSNQSAPTVWSCPTCHKRMSRWAVRDNTVVTCYGAGQG